jgi:hypothetical protein
MRKVLALKELGRREGVRLLVWLDIRSGGNIDDILSLITWSRHYIVLVAVVAMLEYFIMEFANNRALKCNTILAFAYAIKHGG